MAKKDGERPSPLGELEIEPETERNLSGVHVEACNVSRDLTHADFTNESLADTIGCADVVVPAVTSFTHRRPGVALYGCKIVEASANEHEGVVPYWEIEISRCRVGHRVHIGKARELPRKLIHTNLNPNRAKVIADSRAVGSAFLKFSAKAAGTASEFALANAYATIPFASISVRRPSVRYDDRGQSHAKMKCFQDIPLSPKNGKSRLRRHWEAKTPHGHHGHRDRAEGETETAKISLTLAALS